LAKLITAYQQRTFDEDIVYLESTLGGMFLSLFEECIPEASIDIGHR
jgi:hypothetical protein